MTTYDNFYQGRLALITGGSSGIGLATAEAFATAMKKAGNRCELAGFDGIELIVSEKHDLPLVTFSLTLLGGTSQFEPADRRGLARILDRLATWTALGPRMAPPELLQGMLRSGGRFGELLASRQ